MARHRRVRRPAAQHDARALPRRRAGRHARAAADRPAAGQGGRRHDADQLRHLLPHSRARARALGPRAGARGPGRARRSSRSSAGWSARSASPRSRPSWPGPTPPWSGAGSRRWAGRATSSTATPTAASDRACARSAARAAPSSTSASPTFRAPGRRGPRRTRAPAPSASNVRGGRARAVVARTTGGGRLHVECDHVIVACGTIHSPLFLRRQRLGAGSGELGRNLAVHPATGVRALMDEEVDLWRGVPQSYYVDEFADRGVMFEGAAGPPDYVAIAMSGRGAGHRERMEAVRNLSTFGVMVSDSSRGRVDSALGAPRIRYDLDRDDTARFKFGLARLVEAYWAAGAREVMVPVRGRPDPARRRLPPARGGRAAGAGPRAHGLPPARDRAHGRRPGALRPGRRRPRARRRGPARRRRQRRADRARREPPDHDHDPGHPAGLPPASASPRRTRSRRPSGSPRRGWERSPLRRN